MLLNNALTEYEELKKYEYRITTSKYGTFVLNFRNSDFIHLAGIHKMQLLFPDDIKTSIEKYRYLKRFKHRFEKQIDLQIKDNLQQENRITEFHRIKDLLDSSSVYLYKLHRRASGNMYEGEFILRDTQSGWHLMLGLKSKTENPNHIVVYANSWMVDSDKRIPNLIYGIRAITDVKISRVSK